MEILLIILETIGKEKAKLINNILLSVSHDKKLYLCPRKVSTVFCIHDVANDTASSNNGGTSPRCPPFCGKKCESLNGIQTDCNGNGVCTNGKREKTGREE